jgi:Arc/MetJ family transcription regulator
MNMRIAVADDLMNEALRLTGLASSEEVVEVALKELVEKRRQDALAQAFGRLPWDGDLDAMRTGA